MTANLYEGMFVVDASKGGADFPGVVRHIAEILTRNGAEIERIEQWEERKFAYPIQKAKRGIYVLTYFRVDGSAIDEIRHMVGLSEELLRVLVLSVAEPAPVKGQLYSAEGEQMDQPEPAPPPAPPAAAVEPAEQAAGEDDETEDAEDTAQDEPEPAAEEAPEPAERAAGEDDEAEDAEDTAQDEPEPSAEEVEQAPEDE